MSTQMEIASGTLRIFLSLPKDYEYKHCSLSMKQTWTIDHCSKGPTNDNSNSTTLFLFTAATKQNVLITMSRFNNYMKQATISHSTTPQYYHAQQSSLFSRATRNNNHETTFASRATSHSTLDEANDKEYHQFASRRLTNPTLNDLLVLRVRRTSLARTELAVSL